MSITSERIKDAKAALKVMSSKKQAKLTKRQFIARLIEGIHAKMQAGFQLSEICEAINNTLPVDEQIKISTFRAYVRAARDKAGIKPLKSWTRRTPKSEDEIPEFDCKADTKSDNIARSMTSTENQFRDTRGDL